MSDRLADHIERYFFSSFSANENGMKALVQRKYGPADVLQVAEIERPTVGPDDVLVRVRAVGVAPNVWHLMTGEPYLLRVAGCGLRRPKVEVPGTDLAGHVEAVGQNVTRLKPGDEVLGYCERAYAEYVCGNADKFVARPAGVSFEEAAAVPDSAVTALHAIRDSGRVAAGQNVLVIGAGGGVGTFAVQIAKTYRAEVTGVCSTPKIELVQSLGAEHVIDYTQENIVDSGRKYDVIIDTAGNRRLSQLRAALAGHGTLVIVGGEGSGRWLGVGRQLRGALWTPLIGQKLCTLLSLNRSLADLEFVKDLIEAGQVKPVVGRVFESLEEVPQAIRHWAQGHCRGKIVVRI